MIQSKPFRNSKWRAHSTFSPSAGEPPPAVLLRELKAMKAVAAGPSGLGKTHLLHLSEHAGAADLFAAALSQLYATGDWAPLKLLPKPGGRWRPIAIQETLLVAFHRLVLKQTPGLRSGSLPSPPSLRRDCHLLTVDVKNAFNSVPHPVLLFSLPRRSATWSPSSRSTRCWPMPMT